MKHKCDGCRYKGEHQEMMFRPFGVCTKELNLRDAEAAYDSDNCPYQLTNGDMIRKMSDKELAAFLCGIRSDNGGECEGCVAEEYCRIGHTGTIDWIQRPAKEEI